MDNITKFLLKLSAKELQKVRLIFEKIKANDLSTLQVKKLQNHDDLFRVRIGEIRIVFKKAETNQIIDVNYRKNIYKHL